MNILTAREFIAQGTSAAAVLSIAKFHLSFSNHELAGRIRRVAEEVADLTGVRIYALPRRRKPANDNSRRRGGARRAA